MKPLDLYLFPDTLQVLLHVLYAEGNALRYTIDITKPEGSRIATLTYQSQPCVRRFHSPYNWIGGSCRSIAGPMRHSRCRLCAEEDVTHGSSTTSILGIAISTRRP